jgi:spore coat protein A, manganese oxidase
MSIARPMSRRDVLKVGALGSAAMILPFERGARTSGGALSNRMPSSKLPAPYTRPFAAPPALKPKDTGVLRTFQDGSMRLHDLYQLEQRREYVEIIPGYKTGIFGYNGITPGPTIIAERGRPIIVQHVNKLPLGRDKGQPWSDLGAAGNYEAWTSTHLHGSASLPEYDGYASDITRPGQYKNYHYPNFQDARTLWYHDHGVHHTGENAYLGLAAQYHLHETDKEKALGLPMGYWEGNSDGSGSGYDVPLIIKDAMFADGGNGQAPLLFDNSSGSGVYGDVILVNGVPWPNIKVERRKYRFRILNASISRSYKLRLMAGSSAVPVTVVATDGGIVPKRIDGVKDIRLSMAERYEIVIDFTNYKIGDKLQLKNLLPPNNINYTNVDKIMQFEVYADAKTPDTGIAVDLNPRDTMALSGRVNPTDPLRDPKKDSVRSRSLRFERTNGIWTVNGTTWEDVIDTEYKYCLANPGRDEIETWTLQNSSGGWFHPVHIHLIDFKIISRTGGDTAGRDSKGLYPYEYGPKDVVYVGENETVKVAMKFELQDGRYMVHCHNLVHEDHDMMGQFWVGASKECLSKSSAKLATGSGALDGEQCNPISGDAARDGSGDL